VLPEDRPSGHHGRIIKYYRRQFHPPRGWTQEQLAEALQVSVRWVQAMEKMPFIHSISRRRALSLILGIPAVLLDLEETEHHASERAARHKNWMLESLEEGIRSRWQLYYTTSNTVTEDGLLEQIAILEQLADEGGEAQERLARLLSQAYQLAGEGPGERFQSHRASMYFREAERMAEEANSSDLLATAIARHGLVLLRQGTPHLHEALTLYQHGAELARRAEPHVSAYVLSGLAETLARTGEQSACYRALDQASHCLHRGRGSAPEEDMAFVRLSLQSLADARGECFVLLGEPMKGLDYLQRAERQLDPTLSRNHCRLLMQQAEAYLAAGEVDACVASTLEGLRLAQALRSGGSINWAHELHGKLRASKWKHEPVVGQLGAALISSEKRGR
jgi:transcriptional regulator with XRE-family HTH domain